MTETLSGQVALVTGAARGIGAEIAETFARQGATVVLVDVNEPGEMVRKIREEVPGARVEGRSVDVRDAVQVKEAVDWTVETFGQLNILVNNAGTCARVSLEEMTDELWERDLDTNLKGTFLFTKNAVYPHMADRKSGTMGDVSGGGGVMGGPLTRSETDRRSGPAYASSKGGVIALTNLLKVVPRVSPKEIQRSIEEALARNARLTGSRIAVAVNGTEVVLTGTVRSWAERKEAELIAWRAPGVSQVDNRITIES